MEIKTKFNLGDTVCVENSGAEMSDVIVSIVVSSDGIVYMLKYLGGFHESRVYEDYTED